MATREMKALPRSTSREPAFPECQRGLFREVLELLNWWRIPYAVSGAFALHHHTGIWRDTKDLDLFVPGEHVVEALRRLSEGGFRTEVADDVWIAKALRGPYVVDLITGMSNAAITVERSWIERSTPCTVVGVPSRVLAVEELVASKVFVASRDRFDGADVAHIIYVTRGEFDWELVLDLLSQHGDHREMLLWHLVLFHYVYPEQASYVPLRVWEGLLSAFRRSLTRPDPVARFRGSLIDENMFSIDVTEWGLPNVIEELRSTREPKIPCAAASDGKQGH